VKIEKIEEITIEKPEIKIPKVKKEENNKNISEKKDKNLLPDILQKSNLDNI
jgi:hypothetical protein